MIKKIGFNITIFNTIVLAAVLIYGIVSVVFSKDILHMGYKIEKENGIIYFMDSIHSDVYRLVLITQHFLSDPEKIFPPTIKKILKRITEKAEKYNKLELSKLSEENGGNAGLFALFLKEVGRLEQGVALLSKFKENDSSLGGQIRELLSAGYHLESIASELKEAHLKKIAHWEIQSISDMWKIQIFYFVFFILGGVGVYSAHIVITRKVVKPIKELVAATEEIAAGAFEKRVYTESQTEIGQLYKSFNKMAEKISTDEALLRKMNEDLEKKIQKRTEELKKTYEQLVKTKETLSRAEKIAAVGQIAAGVAHEIKNPLNSVYINIQMLLRDQGRCGSDVCPYYNSTSLIQHEINRINNILDEFVNFARFPEPKFFENDLNVVISEVAELLSQSVKEAGVELTLELPDIPVFYFDARQFKEVFMNLVQNATKATKAGGELSIKSKSSEDDATVWVTDNGKGIKEKDLEKIFTPFFSTKQEGMGLGLSIVQRIVEGHGGKITCKSVINKGTTFEITLPFERG